MSLLDTIKKAKEEAIQAGTLPSSSAKQKQAPKDDKRVNERRGALERSLTRAKPTREKAKGVQTASHGPKPSLLKLSAGREARKQERIKRDQHYAATRVLLDQNPEYRRYQTVLWIMLGAGLISIVLSWVINYLQPHAMSDLSSPEGMLEVALLVLAYAFVIAGFVYDLIKAKPIRRAAEARATALSPKKIRELLMNDQGARPADESIASKIFGAFRKKD